MYRRETPTGNWKERLCGLCFPNLFWAKPTPHDYDEKTTSKRERERERERDVGGVGERASDLIHFSTKLLASRDEAVPAPSARLVPPTKQFTRAASVPDPELFSSVKRLF